MSIRPSAHQLLRFSLITGLLLLYLPAAAITSGPVERDHIVVELVSELSSIQPGQSFRVGLSMQHAPCWHTYWINPGDSGLETRFVWQLPEGAARSNIELRQKLRRSSRTAGFKNKMRS